jgi:HEAT repeat protein
LIEALTDEDPGVRERAAVALGRLGPEAKPAVPALILAIRDESNWVIRAEAAIALGNIGPEAKAALRTLVAALRDDSEYVREQAARALLQIVAEEGAGRL